MRAALDSFNAKIAGIIKGRVVLGLDECKSIEHGVAVARAIEEKLDARVEGDEEILVAIMARLNEVRQSVAGPFDLVAAHRS